MFGFTFSLHLFVLAGMIAMANVSRAAGLLEIRNTFPLLKARMNVGTIPSFYKRQTNGGIPDVPPECQSECDPVTPILAADNCTVSTCCQTSFEMNYFNCFKCLANLVNETDFSQPQQLVDTLIDECAIGGVALPKLTFPGQNPNRVLSSVVSNKASTASFSLPQTSNSGASTPTSAIQQTTITAISTTPSSAISQVTVTVPPSASSTNSNSATLPTNTSAGIKSADSRLAFGMATGLLWAYFYFTCEIL